MIGTRLKKAKHIAKKRFKFLYTLHPPRFWMKDIEYDMSGQRFGILRKTNMVNHFRSNINPRHCGFYNGEKRLTIQERKAPTIEEFFEDGETWDSDDHEKWYYRDCWEEYQKDLEWMMMDELLKAEMATDTFYWGD